MSALRSCLLAAGLGLVPAALRAQPAMPVEVPAESVAIAYSQRHFDGITIDTVILHAKSVQFITDTLGAWTPHGEGTTDGGVVFRHRKHASVFITLSPFAGPGPAKDADQWRGYRWEAASRLGPDTVIEDVGESGEAGGVPAVASWRTREVVLATSLTPEKPARLERHVVASDGQRGVLIILAGPATDVTRVEQDFRFLLARLERQPVQVASRD